MSLSSTQSTMFIKLVGIGLVFNPRKPADLYQAQWKNLREKSLKVLEKTRTISTNHRLSFPGWTRTLSMKQSNPSITKVFILSITFLFCWCLAQFWNISYFLINFSSVDVWPTRRAPLGQPPAKISHVFQQISTATGRLIAGKFTSSPLNPSYIIPHPIIIHQEDWLRVVASSITSSPLYESNQWQKHMSWCLAAPAVL